MSRIASRVGFGYRMSPEDFARRRRRRGGSGKTGGGGDVAVKREDVGASKSRGEEAANMGR